MSNLMKLLWKKAKVDDNDPIGSFYRTYKTIQMERIFVRGGRPFTSAKEFFELSEQAQRGAVVLHRRLKCKDGFNMSVQAGYTSYCSPRETILSHHQCYYDSFEVGMPSENDDLLKPYQEDGSKDMTSSVFGYVPRKVINKIILKHGGLSPMINLITKGNLK